MMLASNPFPGLVTFFSGFVTFSGNTRIYSKLSVTLLASQSAGPPQVNSGVDYLRPVAII